MTKGAVYAGFISEAVNVFWEGFGEPFFSKKGSPSLERKRP